MDNTKDNECNLKEECESREHNKFIYNECVSLFDFVVRELRAAEAKVTQMDRDQQTSRLATANGVIGIVPVDVGVEIRSIWEASELLLGSRAAKFRGVISSKFHVPLEDGIMLCEQEHGSEKWWNDVEKIPKKHPMRDELICAAGYLYDIMNLVKTDVGAAVGDESDDTIDAALSLSAGTILQIKDQMQHEFLCLLEEKCSGSI